MRRVLVVIAFLASAFVVSCEVPRDCFWFGCPAGEACIRSEPQEGDYWYSCEIQCGSGYPDCPGGGWCSCPGSPTCSRCSYVNGGTPLLDGGMGLSTLYCM